MTEEQPTKDLVTKPPTVAPGVPFLTKGKFNKQIKARPRYPPPAPGFFPPALDNVITMTIQLIITIWSFFTIFTSIAVARDRDDFGWIILFEIIFTYSGFAYFTHKIKQNIIVYKKFYEKITEWHYRNVDRLLNRDRDTSCWGTKLLFVKLVYWTYIILIFPVVIVWSMWQSYRFYQDRRKNAHSEDGHTEKTDKRVYSVWALGILSKQASMITLFIQDIPLMIICAIIGNWTFFSVYLVMIIQKIVFWMKYVYDVGCRMFYDAGDYARHFGMKSIMIKYLEMLKCYDVDAEPFSKEEMELATLQEGDWIRIWIGKEEYIPDETEFNPDDWRVLIVYKNKHFKETDNLVCIDWYGIPIERFDDFFEGKTKKLEVPLENVHTINRWEPGLHLGLLNDIMYEKYRGYGAKNDDNGDENDENEEKDDDRTNVIESDGNKNGDEIDTEIKSNGGDEEDDLHEARVIDMPEKEDEDDGVTADNVNNNEENVVADSETLSSNKATEVENEENEEIVNNPESIQSDDIENNETEKLNDSPVVVDEEDVNEEENDYGGDGGDEYVQIPLTSHDEINENES